MSLSIASLNSGSNGNCYYVGNEQDAVLIDVGISTREVVKRLRRMDLSIDRIKAVFISHEHSDHIVGISKLSRKFKIPVYVTKPTLQNSTIAIDDALQFSFLPYEEIQIGSLSVRAFPKYHDAIDPHSFIVSDHEVKVGVFTDIGYACQHVIHHFKQCHAVFLESNYDEEMLLNGPYPYALKNRIRGGHGHLSNKEAYHLVKNHKPEFLSHLILSHLSKTNNKPAIVEELFSSFSSSFTVVVASRNHETDIFKIHNGLSKTKADVKAIQFSQQLELF